MVYIIKEREHFELKPLQEIKKDIEGRRHKID